ncbi:MAG: hypothetical protein FJZ38_14480 [Candidatus Rokubacteria bacterium]|nr:hypothetical protein [Candidatus Rokubacteria bacterium]
MSGTRSEGLRRVEKEIASEKAAALGRAGERLEAALAETRDLGARLLGTHDAAERERLAEAYASARRRALQARMALLIQREALGLRRHATVDQQFPEPPSVADLLRRAGRA